MKNLRAGFTLVELVVVIAILGILAGLAIPRFVNANMAARGSKIFADMNACESAINLYYVRTGSFPADMYTAKEYISKTGNRKPFTIEAENKLKNLYKKLEEKQNKYKKIISVLNDKIDK